MNMTDEATNTNAFPKNALEQAAIAAKIKPSSYLARRLDLRGKTVLAFGDSKNGASECAISLYRTPQGWQLGIHTADVAEYVCDGSPLDNEARKRRASVRNEFIQTDMLPESITQDICNLSVGGDKLALSVLLDIDKDGELISIQFEESVLRVAERCIFDEIDQYGLALDTSSVLALREKYMPYTSILADMYELAAMFYRKRLQRGALDCPVFRREFKRDENGNPISFELKAEPDARAMVREIGYYAAEAIGNYMYSHGLPCIFVGQEGIDDYATEYLCRILGIEDENCPCHFKSSEIIKRAKGSPYYDFVCEALYHGLPCPEYSVQPIYNIHCASDKVVSFVRPASRYADLLAQRALKTSIAAAGNPNNINLNRHRALIQAAAEEANASEKHIYGEKTSHHALAAAKFIEQNADGIFEGFPLIRRDCGDIPVLLYCGAKAIIPAELADGYEFSAGTPDNFRILALATENELIKVAPIK